MLLGAYCAHLPLRFCSSSLSYNAYGVYEDFHTDTTPSDFRCSHLQDDFRRYRVLGEFARAHYTYHQEQSRLGPQIHSYKTIKAQQLVQFEHAAEKSVHFKYTFFFCNIVRVSASHHRNDASPDKVYTKRLQDNAQMLLHVSTFHVEKPPTGPERC